MSIEGDARWHQDGVRWWQSLFSRRLMRKRDREAMVSKRVFIEFYDETGKPAPTGILSDVEYYVALSGPGPNGAIVLDIDLLRRKAYRDFARHVEWVGDHGRAFSGVFVDVTRLASLGLESIDASEREQILAETERLRMRPAPPQPPKQDGLPGL